MTAKLHFKHYSGWRGGFFADAESYIASAWGLIDSPLESNNFLLSKKIISHFFAADWQPSLHTVIDEKTNTPVVILKKKNYLT